jgi:Uma2 family endonuclease
MAAGLKPPLLSNQIKAVDAPLQTGDRLTRDEFERRYTRMHDVKKAELIEGVVYMPSPVNQKKHAGPHSDLVTWMGNYRASTPGVLTGDNGTVRLDLDNEPQPDAMLFIEPEHGGQTSYDREGYLEGAPELVAEVAASSVSYDLHDKLQAYRRNGVREYIVWRVLDEELDWFILREGRYDRLEPEDGVIKSIAFPGLWLDAAALIRGELSTVLTRLNEGLASSAHEEFTKSL